MKTARATTSRMKTYGDVGIVTYDPIEDKLQCHLCGKWFRGLSVHVVVAHGWTADEYREEFGLNRNQALICEGTREKLSRINRELGLWKHLNSQTMTKPELLEFLKGICLAPGYKLREQYRIQQSERLRKNNPMNDVGAQQRSRAKLRIARYLLIFTENISFSAYLFDKSEGKPDQTKEFNMPASFKGYMVPGSLPDKCSKCRQPVWVAPSSWLIKQDNPGIEVLCIPCALDQMKQAKHPKIEGLTPAQAEEVKEYIRTVE